MTSYNINSSIKCTLGLCLIFAYMTSDASGGQCTRSTEKNTIYFCTGPADNIMDTPVSISSEYIGNLSFIADSGFGIDTSLTPNPVHTIDITHSDSQLSILDHSQSSIRSNSIGMKVLAENSGFDMNWAGKINTIGDVSRNQGDAMNINIFEGAGTSNEPAKLNFSGEIDSIDRGILFRNLARPNTYINISGHIRSKEIGLFTRNDSDKSTINIEKHANIIAANAPAIVALFGLSNLLHPSETLLPKQVDVVLDGTLRGGPSGGAIDVASKAQELNRISGSGNILGHDYGMRFFSEGSAESVINFSGKIIGETYDGLWVSHKGADLSVDVSDVYGDQSGLYVYNQGIGSTHILTNGNIEGRKRFGLYAKNRETAKDMIVEINGTISGGDGPMNIENLGSGITSVVVGPGGVDESGPYSLDNIFGGLYDNDTLVIDAGSSTVKLGANLHGFESIILKNGIFEISGIVGDTLNTKISIFNANLKIKDYLTVFGDLHLDNKSSIGFANKTVNFHVEGSVSNHGTIDLRNGEGGDVYTIAGKSSGKGTYYIDTPDKEEMRDILLVYAEES